MFLDEQIVQCFKDANPKSNRSLADASIKAARLAMDRMDEHTNSPELRRINSSWQLAITTMDQNGIKHVLSREGFENLCDEMFKQEPRYNDHKSFIFSK